MNYQQGDAVLINDTFRKAGTETNPTAIIYTIQNPDGSDTVFNWPGDPEVTNTGAGVFSLALGAPALPGFYTYDVDATGTVVASRQGAFTILPNAASSTAVTWAVGGPCDPWVSSQDIWECCGQPMVTVDGDECPADMTAFALEASQILFELGGRLHAGSCEKTVRPCSTTSGCGVQVLSRGHVINWGGQAWSSSCGCSPLSRVLLSGYPVREVTEVKIDGDIVAPDTYRLDGWRWLVRKDGASWPGCQQLDRDDTDDGTFSVSYRYGQDPPLIGSDAAAQLGCELFRACSGGECALPSGTTRIVRQGVTIERLAFAAWGRQQGIWRTGLTKVDAYLNMVSPGRLTRRPVFWSPDGPQYARKVG